MTADITLVDKVIVITGASRGIGAAIATAAANAGASVVLASRKQEGLDAVAPHQGGRPPGEAGSKRHEDQLGAWLDPAQGPQG